MKKSILHPFTLAVALFIATTTPKIFASEFKVVTTTTTLQSIAEYIGESVFKPESITKGPQDPHFVEPKPSYMVRLRSADLLVVNGLDLEIGWLGSIIKGARTPKLNFGQPGYFDAGSVIDAIEVSKGGVDRTQGDVHPFGNPHYLLDPLRAKKVAEALTKRLSDLDSAHAEIYSKNLNTFSNEIDRRLTGWQARVQKTNVRSVITYHKTLSYFLDRFQIQNAGQIEPKPGVPPAAKQIFKLIDVARSQKVHCILVESFFEPTIAKRIAKEVSGVEVQIVPVEVGALAAATNYFEMIEAIVKALEACK